MSSRDLARVAHEVRRGGYHCPVCNRYVSPDEAEMERAWHVGARDHWRGGSVFPRKLGPFICAGADGGLELAVGQWGLIPWFAKEAKLKYSTNNARIETAPTAATFKLPRTRGQRCLIPAQSFDGPNWESGKTKRWHFRRADGRTWGLAVCGTPGRTRRRARSSRATRCS